MSVITVEGKVIGQKRPIFSDWRVDLPPIQGHNGSQFKLRDLIRSVVIKEVEGFMNRQEERKLTRVMSRQEIDEGAERGKVDPGEHDLQRPMNTENAVIAALQAFEDGLYFVFIDQVQQTNLDSEVFLRTNSNVVFLRLTALVGG